MLMRVGDEQRKKVIITQNLGQPYIFIMFDENKQPTIICAETVTQLMAQNATEKVGNLIEKIKIISERG